MLFNPNWKPETKPDVFSLDSLIAWLETMPGDGGYNYFCMGECLLGQWVKTFDNSAKAMPYDKVDSPFRYLVEGKIVDLSHLEEIAHAYNDPRANSVRWTFGAALTRARKALADQHSCGDANKTREQV